MPHSAETLPMDLGANPRHEHCFSDEDSMQWLKRNSAMSIVMIHCVGSPSTLLKCLCFFMIAQKNKCPILWTKKQLFVDISSRTSSEGGVWNWPLSGRVAPNSAMTWHWIVKSGRPNCILLFLLPLRRLLSMKWRVKEPLDWNEKITRWRWTEWTVWALANGRDWRDPWKFWGWIKALDLDDEMMRSIDLCNHTLKKRSLSVVSINQTRGWDQQCHMFS